MWEKVLFYLIIATCIAGSVYITNEVMHGRAPYYF